MAHEQVTVRSRHAVIYDGTADVTCEEQDEPHTWNVLLRCSQEELEVFRGLPAGQSVEVNVAGAGVGRAQVAAVDGRHVRPAGLGLCPYPSH